MAVMAPVGRSPQEETIELDNEIYHVHQQIQELTKRRRLITNTLLSSSRIQTLLSERNALPDSSLNLPSDGNPLSTISNTSASAETTTQHQINMHRLSFTVTTFPFTDPSPTNNLHGRLLGLRFDHCSRQGTFQKPYYILLRRVEEGGDEWRVHRHTIPAFVPLGAFEEEFLPLKGGDGYDDGEFGEENESRSAGVREEKQDLHTFVRKIRQELVCWNLRREAVELLKSELRLETPAPAPAADGEGEEDTEDGPDDTETSDPDTTTQGLCGVGSIEPTSFEARQARITWTDGTIARIKISDRGLVEKAVVVGDSGRIRGVENLLVDGESRVEDLVRKLRVLVGEET